MSETIHVFTLVEHYKHVNPFLCATLFLYYAADTFLAGDQKYSCSIPNLNYKLKEKDGPVNLY